jgi:enoyl-CoA hydratase/carnithine racemase
VHFGSAWPVSFASLLRAKVGDHRLQRKIAPEGHRFTPEEALAHGLVDHIVAGGTRAILAKAEEIAECISANAQPGAWGMVKVSIPPFPRKWVYRDN